MVRWNGGHICSYAQPQVVLDPLNLHLLPPESQLREWKKKIGTSVDGTWKYVETGKGKLDASCIDQLLKLNTAKQIQQSVEEEIKWFCQQHSQPETVVDHPPASQIEKFQELLYCNRYDAIQKPYDMSANELAMLCADRWVSSDHICWLVNTLNNSQNDTYFSYLNNALHRNPNTLQPFLPEGTKPSKLCFAINVAKGRGKTFISTFGQLGNHWTLCHVDTIEKKIVYGDSLGWQVPENLFCKLDEYIKAIDANDTVKEYMVTISHDPNSKCHTTGAHKCSNNCVEHYPLQTCSNICGVVVMVVAAIACHNSDLFTNLTNQPTFTGTPPIYLRNPSRFSKYLRLVIGCWISSNEVSISHVVPQYWQKQQGPLASQSDIREASSEGKRDKATPGVTPSGETEQSQKKQHNTHGGGKETGQLPVGFDNPSKKQDNPPPETNQDNASARKNEHKCSTCGSIFTKKCSLKRHIRTKHPDVTPDNDGRCVCEHCGFKCHWAKNLKEHLGKEHGVVFHTETIMFKNRTG